MGAAAWLRIRRWESCAAQPLQPTLLPDPHLRADHCHYSNRSKLHIIDIQPMRCNKLENYPQLYTDAVACLSDAPLCHLAGPSLAKALTPVRQACLGLGPRCAGYIPGCYTNEYGPLPPNERLLRMWRRSLSACLQLPAMEQPAPVQPLRLLLVDRQEQESRCGGGPPSSFPTQREASLLLSCSSPTSAHVPVPARVLDPSPALPGISPTWRRWWQLCSTGTHQTWCT